jgi:hypothetical protein
MALDSIKKMINKLFSISTKYLMARVEYLYIKSNRNDLKQHKYHVGICDDIELSLIISEGILSDTWGLIEYKRCSMFYPNTSQPSYDEQDIFFLVVMINAGAATYINRLINIQFQTNDGSFTDEHFEFYDKFISAVTGEAMKPYIVERIYARNTNGQYKPSVSRDVFYDWHKEFIDTLYRDTWMPYLMGSGMILLVGLGIL